ncbi:hypothetical protein [Nocardia blacklockiae]|uniref:hypothetical protein n=1 Tax=Nocardia blacklockiae TaxID=480036 RepID=UPI00189345F8|nr:hypothetical protein [Nocardia blacklockiae]MBF6172463.1 hypothetical protein [Nocardia blacklockiae]
MWEWSRTVAERAAAAVWTGPARESRPTVVDPEPWRETTDSDNESNDADRMSAPALLGEYCLIG